MAITYNDRIKTWKLDTPNTSYIIGVVDEKYLAHIYYGARVEDDNLSYLLRPEEIVPPSIKPEEQLGFMDFVQLEYPCQGIGDFRECCLSVKREDGQIGCDLTYKSYEIVNGKDRIKGLPTCFGENAKTLVIRMTDEISALEVLLSFTVYEDCDAVIRSAKIQNIGKRAFYLERAMSACLDLELENCEVITECGAWAREHIIERTKLNHAAICAESMRGEEGHDAMPFMAVVSSNTDQNSGEVYAAQLVYSGNFLAKVKKNPHDQIRMVMGINPETFTWKLGSGQSFRTPEAVLVYSACGLGQMTRTFHDLFRNHLIRQDWVRKERPILINNWEATYFDFDKDKLLEIGREAKKRGIELQVLDDGWFGYNRNQPSGGLGDWYVNEDKLEGGLKGLTDELDKIGMKFGLWFEPEMICEDTDLYKKHPEWVLHQTGRIPARARDQWLLDYSNPEVRDYIFESIAGIVRSVPVVYIKWDMNRAISDVGSDYLPADRQGEIWHRHVLGVYEIQERLTEEFPYLLLENCSSGGARFDAGMLYYSPQIWCSDDMDPVERLSIQEGTAMLYPVSAIGSHVAKSPNDISWRSVSFESRAVAAMFGTFGYELDITKLPEEERNQIPGQIERYKSVRKLILEGNYYRIASYRENKEYDAYMIVSGDKKEAFMVYMQVLSKPNSISRRVKLQGLDPEVHYDVNGAIYGGDVLMNAGLPVQRKKDFEAQFVRIKEMLPTS
jgi:alpha-galactosidase